MTNATNEAVIVLLANDALEATGQDPAVATILLIDAAMSILVTCHHGASARRELAGVLSKYVRQQVDTIIQVSGGAHG